MGHKIKVFSFAQSVLETILAEIDDKNDRPQTRTVVFALLSGRVQLFCAYREGEGPVSCNNRFVDIALSWMEVMERSNPDCAIISGLAVGVRLDFVAVDSETGKGLGDCHVFAERVSNPVGALVDGDRMLSWIDGQAR